MVLPIPSGGPTDHTTYVPIGVGGTSPIGPDDFDIHGNCMFTAPTVLGQYRLSVWVYNTQNKYAYHNVPFTVSNTPSAYTYTVTQDSYIQGPQATGSTTTNAASASATNGGGTILLGNSYANTKNITYFPYLYFDLTQSQFYPKPASTLYPQGNLPTQVSLNVFSIGGQMSYYNLSVYPVNTPSSWNQNSLSFMSLQTSQASTFYTYNQAGYQYPYSPGLGGSSGCTRMANVPSSVTACTPLVRVH
jgi:hypothetical protein